MKKIACVIGTRPQFIKHAALVRHLQAIFEVVSIDTTQHHDYSMSGLLKEELFAQHPFINLSLEPNLSPTARLGETVSKLASVAGNAHPDAILVYGDTDSTLAGALFAAKSRLPLIHVEAGERSFNNAMPEEANRRVTDLLSTILFCASPEAAEQLAHEHNGGTVVYTGDLMKDAVVEAAKLFQNPIMPQPYYYCTLHRNYTNQNVQKLVQVLTVLNALNMPVLFPVHPATRLTLQPLLAQGTYQNIQFTEPLSYHASVRHLKFAAAVITDSGGLQKEAYWLQKRCITLRPETEWTATLQGNWNQLVYDDVSVLAACLAKPLGVHDPLLYGDGGAAKRITENLISLM